MAAKSASRPESAEPSLLLRLPEAARLLGLSLAYIYVLKDAGKIRVRSIGRAARIHRDDLEAFAAGLPMAPLKYGSEPTGPLLGVDQRRLVSDAPKRKRRKAKAKTKAKARSRVVRAPAPAIEAEPEPPAPVEPPPADEPPAPLDQQLDLAAVYAERVKLTRGNYVAGSGEPELRALEHAVNVYRQNHPDVRLNDAKQMVLDAIKRSSTKEATTP